MSVKSDLQKIGILAQSEAVCLNNCTTLDEVSGNSRKKNVCRARHKIWRMIHDEGFSLMGIGRMFCRDHTTIMYGLKRSSSRKNLIEIAGIKLDFLMMAVSAARVI